MENTENNEKKDMTEPNLAKEYNRKFNAWYKDHKNEYPNERFVVSYGRPLREKKLDENGEVIRTAKGIPQYKTTYEAKPSYLWAISDNGTVITINPGNGGKSGTKPKINFTPEGYAKHDTNDFINRCVWFSFAYDAIKNDNLAELPDIYDPYVFKNHKIKQNLETLARLYTEKETYTDKNGVLQERILHPVHHKDRNNTNNLLSNLQLENNRISHNQIHDTMEEFDQIPGIKVVSGKYETKKLVETGLQELDDGLRTALFIYLRHPEAIKTMKDSKAFDRITDERTFELSGGKYWKDWKKEHGISKKSTDVEIEQAKEDYQKYLVEKLDLFDFLRIDHNFQKRAAKD